MGLGVGVRGKVLYGAGIVVAIFVLGGSFAALNAGDIPGCVGRYVGR